MSDHLDARLGQMLHGELAASERAACEAHLRDCASCRAELESLREAHAWMQDFAAASPPDALWERIDSELRTPRRSRRRWAVVPLAAAAALVFFLLPRGDSSRVLLEPYFVQVENSAGGASALDLSPAEFIPLSPKDALIAAGMEDAPRQSPNPDFELWHGANRHFDQGEITQLVYRAGERCFSVFLASHAARLDFGGRTTQRVRMGDWECTQIESEGLLLYWSASADRQSLLIAPADAELDVADVLGFFVYGRWTEES